MRNAVFCDGFNLYHAISSGPCPSKYKWLDLRKLASAFIKSSDEITRIFYFSSLAVWDEKKVERHRLYIRALKSDGVQVILGAFRRKEVRCRLCKGDFLTYAEKETDVNIAIRLFQEAIADSFDTALIISGDSDLLPAIRAVKETFPMKRVGVVIPPGRQAELLKQETDFHMKIKEHHLESCQFPDAIKQKDGSILHKPKSWS